MYIAVDVKYPLFLSDFNATRLSSTHFQKIFMYIKYISNLMKVRRVGDELFPANRLTDNTKPIASVRNFANAHED